MRVVLRHHGLWKHLLPWHTHNKNVVSQFQEGAKLTVLLDSVSAVSIGVLNGLISGKINLREAKVVLQNEEPLYELIAALHAAKKCGVVVMKQRLTNAAKSVKSLDDKLQRFQCLLNTFCTCGIAINVSKLKGAVEQLSRDYDQIHLEQAPVCLDSADKLLGKHTKWLYSLRTSELFLQLWRKSGNEVLAVPKITLHKMPKWLEIDKNPFGPPPGHGPLSPGHDGEGPSLTLDRLVRELFPLVQMRWKVVIVDFLWVVFVFYVCGCECVFACLFCCSLGQGL